MNCHTDELWYAETVSLWMEIYMLPLPESWALSQKN